MLTYNIVNTKQVKKNMKYRRERPCCRKALLYLCQEYNCDLQKMLNHSQICLSHDLKIQARKMISEGEFRSGKELKNFEEKIILHKVLGLIKK